MASKELPAFQPGLSLAEKSHAEIFWKEPGQVSAAEAVTAKAVTPSTLNIFQWLRGVLHRIKGLAEELEDPKPMQWVVRGGECAWAKSLYSERAARRANL